MHQQTPEVKTQQNDKCEKLPTFFTLAAPDEYRRIVCRLSFIVCLTWYLIFSCASRLLDLLQENRSQT